MIKRILMFALLCTAIVRAQDVTLTGKLLSASGLPAKNYIITAQPSQFFYIAASNVVVNSPVECATTIDGSVVGLPNPSQPLITNASFTGTLPAGTYYVLYTWSDSGGRQTLAGNEQQVQLSAAGTITLSVPAAGMPLGASGMFVYIGTTSGRETLQGSTSGTAAFVQNSSLILGRPGVPSQNATICQMVANDAGWPTGTSYVVTLTDPNGNTLPGYPMSWQLLGPGSTINLSNGLPLYNGLVTYPSPILAQPYNHVVQSISGPLSLSGYNLLSVQAIGVGTALPAWGVDVEGSGLLGDINVSGGYLVDGISQVAGFCLGSDGSSYDLPFPCTNSVIRLVTTAATSDTITVTGMTSAGHCTWAPTNASAASNIATAYISARATNSITVTHAATAGMTFDIACSFN